MIGWIVEKISSWGWRMKWRRLRPVTTRASLPADRSVRREGRCSARTSSRGASAAARRARRRRRAPRARGPVRAGAVLARRRARELQEHVVQRRAAQPEVAHPDPRVTQRRSGVLDQLEAIARRGQRELVEALARLGLAAAHPGEHGLRLVALSGAGQLDLEDLPADAILELVAGPLRDHPAVIDHRDPVGELVGLLEVLGREHDRRPLAHELAHDRPDLVAAARIEPGGGLVEKQDPRTREQARREVEPAAHPSGVRACRAVGGVGELEALQQLVRPPSRLVAREVEQAAEHLQVLPSGEDLVDGRELPGEPEQLANGRGLVHHVAPEYLRAPRVRREQRREHAHERGLPGPVRPEQPEDRPLRDVEVDSRQRNRRAEALDHALDVNGGSGGAGRSHRSRDDTRRPSHERSVAVPSRSVMSGLLGRRRRSVGSGPG